MIYNGVPCDEWDGPRDKLGYGKLGSKLTHRLAWIKAYGWPPAATPLVLHHCDNPPCRELAHLFLGTHADNARDCAAKGRKWNQGRPTCPEGHPWDYIKPSGVRICRRCVAAYMRRYRARKAEACV